MSEKSQRPSFDPSVDTDGNCYGEFCVLSLGKPFKYVIPSFDVLCVELRLIRVEGVNDDGQNQIYDIFIRNDPDLNRVYPTWMSAMDVCIVEKSEFEKYVNLEGFDLPPQGAFIIWEWEWADPDCDTADWSEPEAKDPYIHSSGDEARSHDSKSGNESDDSPSEVENAPVHVVTFKCIGCNRDPIAQDALQQVATKVRSGETVPVELQPEPDNPYDADAIAFVCKLDDRKVRVGYVVREVLSHVHTAIKEGKIQYVRFAWVKYLVTWIRSGPGFYAGIDVAKKGEWADVIQQHRSTR